MTNYIMVCDLYMLCYSAKPWHVVVWLNGSVYISPEIVDNNRTCSRCHVDALNVLHIQNLKIGDGNTYSCIVDERVQAKLILTGDFNILIIDFFCTTVKKSNVISGLVLLQLVTHQPCTSINTFVYHRILRND